MAGAAIVQAHALERVTLRNGFFYDCARHQVLDSTHVRLFLAGAGDTSYIDLPTAEIVSTDQLPAPPASTAAKPVNAAQPADAAPDVPALLLNAGAMHNIDAALLASIVHAESNGHADALSRAGARGLMQLMPSTAHALGVTDIAAPDQNIDGGTAYLDTLLTRYHNNLALALAAYNAGPGMVDRYGGVPPFLETRAYVVRVMSEFKRRKEALAHAASTELRASR